MEKYISSIAGNSGIPISGAIVQVNTYPGGTPAAIYSDNGVTVAPNPLTTDSLGNFAFYAADGRYQFVISGINITTTTVNDVQLLDMVGAIGATTLPASTGKLWNNGGVISVS